jgi:serine/threonine-protein kinase RsbT
MITDTEKTVVIGGESDIVYARQLARQVAQDLSFGAMDRSRIATAVSELARNVVRYANEGKGEMHVREIRNDAGRTGIEIVVQDEGPGIEDIDLVMQQGFSSGSGLGLGLGCTKRLMDEMEIDSAPGRGTTVVIRKWRR